MKITFGSQPETIPDGMLTSIRFPTLALLNTPTGDGRTIRGSGFSSRDLPLSIMFQERTGMGHDGAVNVGALHEVTVDGKSVSGRGYLLKNANGKRAAMAVKTSSMRGNSVDLADVQAEIAFDETTMDFTVEFVKSRLAATTIVATPAFAEAHAIIDDERLSQDDEDVVASLVSDGELVCDGEFAINLVTKEGEIVASGMIVQPSEAFFVPEAEQPQKIVVTEEGWVYGHLGLWNSCHDGIEAKCIQIPKPLDGYASFNKPGVLTDAGMVETGPIFLTGGHKYGEDLEQAYGGIENAWADVRVSVGRHGPWLSGIVRPGVSDEMLYAARASRISGHWKKGRLRAIVSVNAEGFDVPGSASDKPLELVASFVLDGEGEVDELVAGFVGCTQSDPQPTVTEETSTTTEIAIAVEESKDDIDPYLNAMLQLLLATEDDEG